MSSCAPSITIFKMTGFLEYQSKVETAKIVALGVRRHEIGSARFPMSNKRQSFFGTLEYPNCISVTVALDGPDSRKIYAAKKFRLPSDIQSFEVVRNSKSHIVINVKSDFEKITEIKGEDCEWMAGEGSGRFSFGKVFRRLLILLGKWF